jgi:hypothetical protein
MKFIKGQVSFEYITLFSILLVLLIIVGSVVLVGMDRMKKLQRDGQRLADEIKVEVITASLSRMDYSYVFELPSSIDSEDFNILLYGDTDNMLLIKSNDKEIGKVFLRIVSSCVYSDGGCEFSPGDDLLISKINNKIEIGVAS